MKGHTAEAADAPALVGWVRAEQVRDCHGKVTSGPPMESYLTLGNEAPDPAGIRRVKAYSDYVSDLVDGPFHRVRRRFSVPPDQTAGGLFVLQRIFNEKGNLVFAGQDVARLAAQFGTPLYIYDEGLIRRNVRAYRDALRGESPEGRVFYAAKAFLTTAMAALIAAEGMGLDVVSGGELATALQAGCDPRDIIFNGNNKSVEELSMALRVGVGRIVADHPGEIEQLARLSRRLRRRARILIRVNPGVDAHTHEYIQTGITDCKFGMGAHDGVALAAVQAALRHPGIDLVGYHCHIGSQIFDLGSYRTAVRVMAGFSKMVQTLTGYSPAELDMGGGLGIRYVDGDTTMDIPGAVRFICGEIRRAFDEMGQPEPAILLEPGRSIIGEAGLAVYRVGVVKEVPGARTYVTVDGGMTDNPRVALYGSRYEAVLANRSGGAGETRLVTLAGKCCESGDILARDIPLAPVSPGDLVAVFSAGAYQYAMASHYNRLPKPAVVFAHPGGADLVARRENYTEMTRLDILPDRLVAPSREYSVGSR